MKKVVISFSLALMLGVSATAQKNSLTSITPGFNFYSRGLSFYVEPVYDRPVNKETLEVANLISDIVDGYPANWISEYVSVEIKATCHGELLEATSPNATLSKEQKNILKTADLGSDIIINVDYKYYETTASNSADNILYIKMQPINIKLTVTPETEAQYIGGKQLLNTYFSENVINKISGATASKIKSAKIVFTINENGNVENVRVIRTTQDNATDKLLVDAIANMPKWKPAKNAKGANVKQEFKLLVGDYGC